jgi:hypothetical protein
MSAIEVTPVKGFLQFLAFNNLPRKLYAGMAGFAPNLDVERLALYAHRLNPHFKMVEAQEFLAKKDGRVVGRIFAQVYRPEFTPKEASRFQFGSLDAIDDAEVVRALTKAAEDWLRARGADVVHGPFSPSINGECGVLIDGFEAKPMFLTPWHPPYLSHHIDAAGYEKARDLISYRLDTSPDILNEPARISTRREWKNRLNIRPLDLEHLKTGETALMAELFNDAWRDNWGYVPFTLEEFDSMADALKFIVPPEYGIVIELDGAPVSFLVALPNLHEITQDLGGRLFPFGLFKLIARVRGHKFTSARVLLMGSRKALQRSATGGAVLLAMIEEMRRRVAGHSVTHIEAGWVLENNLDMRKPIEMFGGKADKTHRIYEKRL